MPNSAEICLRNGHVTSASHYPALSLRLGPELKTAVRVVYSDESGVGSEREEPFTVVAALMLNIDSQWHPVLRAIDEALREFLGRDQVANYEISGRVLYARIKRGDPQASKLMAALMAIPRKNLVPIFYSAVDRAGFAAVRRVRRVPDGTLFDIGIPDVFAEAIFNAITQVDAYVHTGFPHEQVLWIHDAGRYDEWAKAWLETFQEMTPDRSHIVDTIYFGKSSESRALQLADVCCSTITRHLRGEDIAAPYYQILQRQIVNEGARPKFENADELLEQLGIKIPRRH
jgi:Protein of unknown function (DUF3800)